MKELIENDWPESPKGEGEWAPVSVSTPPHPDSSRQQDGRFCLGPDPVPVFQAGLGLDEDLNKSYLGQNFRRHCPPVQVQGGPGGGHLP